MSSAAEHLDPDDTLGARRCDGSGAANLRCAGPLGHAGGHHECAGHWRSHVRIDGWGVLLDVFVPAIPNGGGGYVSMGKAARATAKGGRSYTPSGSRAWMTKITQRAAVFWRGRPALDEPVCVHIDIVAPRPERVPVGLTREAWQTSARVRSASKASGDVDNVCKAVLDALTKARVWVDDGRVCELVVRRWYAAREDHGPDPVGVRVVVRRPASLTDTA